MNPIFRSINELMVITQKIDQLNKNPRGKDNQNYVEDTCQRKRYIRSKDEKEINLPDLPRTTRHKWVKSKEAVSRFFDKLDYNNQIQSTYDLTLIGRQKNHDYHDVA